LGPDFSQGTSGLGAKRDISLGPNFFPVKKRQKKYPEENINFGAFKG